MSDRKAEKWAYRKRLIAANICPDCGKNPMDRDFMSCAPCREKNRKRHPSRKTEPPMTPPEFVDDGRSIWDWVETDLGRAIREAEQARIELGA